MYKKHLMLAAFIFGVVFAFSFKFQVDYKKISEDATTLVSIAIAVYITVPSFMVGSPYADQYQNIYHTIQYHLLSRPFLRL